MFLKSSQFQLPRSYADWVFKHAKSMVIVLACVTIIFAIGAALTPLSGDPIHAFVDDQVAIAVHEAQVKKFGDDPGKWIIIAADEGDELFSVPKLDAIRIAKHKILQIEEIHSVTTFVDAQRPRKEGSRLTLRDTARRAVARKRLLQGEVPDETWRPDKYWPISARARASLDLSDLKTLATDDDQIAGTLISRDGTKHLFVVAVKPEVELSMPRQVSLTGEIESILKEAKLGSQGLYFAGFPVINAAITGQIQKSFLMLMPFGFVAVGLFMFAVLRRLSVALLSLVIGGIAVIWAMGATSFVFGELTLLVAASPLVILAVSTTDFLHVVAAYQQQLAAKEEQQASITTVLMEVGGACVLTSLTTFVGFGSLLLTTSPGVRQFGFACAIGTAVALLLMVSLLPILLLRMKPIPVAPAGGLTANANRAIERLLNICSQVSRRWPKLIFGLFLLISIPGAMLVYNKEIDADLPNRFSPSHPLHGSLAVLESEFFGSNSIELYLSGQPDQLLSPDILAAIGRFESSTESEANVLEVVSILDILSSVDKAIDLGHPSGLPPDVKSARASLDWVKLLEPRAVESVISADAKELRIQVMLRSIGLRATSDIANQLTTALQKELAGKSVNVGQGGTYTLIGNVTGDIIRSQIIGFWVCLAALTVIMIWGLGSVRVGVLSQIPNLIPVLLMVALVALTRERIDSDMLALPMIALGIAVDDTIHFLHRYRMDIHNGRDSNQAVEQTFHTTGRSIVISTFALAIGLIPLAFAGLLSLWMLGTYLVAGIFGALVSDLLCLPAMIHMKMIRFR